MIVVAEIPQVMPMPTRAAKDRADANQIERYCRPHAAPLRRQFRTLRDAGSNDRSIAAALGIWPSHVRLLAEAVDQGARPETKMRAKVAAMLTQGLSAAVIAQRLGISERSARAHRQAIEGLGRWRADKALAPVPSIALYTPVEPLQAARVPRTGACTYPQFRGACTAARAPGSPYCAEHRRPVYRLSGDRVCISVAA